MAQYFEIKKNSTLPSLRVELIDDGTYDFCRRDIYNIIVLLKKTSFFLYFLLKIIQ